MIKSSTPSELMSEPKDKFTPEELCMIAKEQFKKRSNNKQWNRKVQATFKFGNRDIHSVIDNTEAPIHLPSGTVCMV